MSHAQTNTKIVLLHRINNYSLSCNTLPCKLEVMIIFLQTALDDSPKPFQKTYICTPDRLTELSADKISASRI